MVLTQNISKKIMQYYEFHLAQSNCLWELRSKTKDHRKLWVDCISDDRNKLRLTLLRYKHILSEIKLNEKMTDLFVSRPYTISNIIDDHIHVMRYHNNIDYIQEFGLKDCNTDTCPSWKRFNLPRTKYNIYKHQDVFNDNRDKYFRIHKEEKCLQSIMDAYIVIFSFN